jgi:hypothetical protein
MEGKTVLISQVLRPDGRKEVVITRKAFTYIVGLSALRPYHGPHRQNLLSPFIDSVRVII